MRILITNNSLKTRAGTELVVWELACAFVRRGHEVAAYSSEIGEFAGLIREARVTVVSDLAECPFRPDIIHGQHHLDTMSALLSLPGTPAIYHQHGGLPWEERAPVHPRILQYVAMCPLIKEQICIERGVPEDRVRVVLNWVDMERFHTVRTLPTVPRRALVFTRMLGEGFFLDQVRLAFERKGIVLEEAPCLEKGMVRRPESLLPSYDIVLAAGRSALEAIACGCATMIVSQRSCLGFATPERLQEYRDQNMCPFRDSPELTAELIERQLGEYDVASAAATTARLRDAAGLERAVDDLLGIHEMALQEWRARHTVDEARELKATAKYLRELTPAVKSLEEKQRRIQKLEAGVEALKESNRTLKRRLKTSEPGARLLRYLRKSISGRLILSSVKQKLARGGSEENDADEAR